MLFFLRRWTTSLACLSVLLSALFAVNARAAQLTSVADIMSRQQVSVASNHELVLETPSGVSSPSATIIFTFATGFDLSSLVVGDLDLFHGPTTGLETEETLASAAGTGVWGVAFSGQSITLTSPTDIGTEIATGDQVRLRIGTGASGGAGQIVNPATAAEYSVVVSGDFGDTGTVVIPIVTGDALSVSATIPSNSTGCTSGCGGGGTGNNTTSDTTTSDTTTSTTSSLVLSNTGAIRVTTSSADITWITSLSADATVFYGLTSDYASGQIAGLNLGTEHLISLSGLLPGTTYHVQARSRTAEGVSASSPDITFTTLVPTLVDELVITNPRTTGVTDVSAFVLWETNREAMGTVEYGSSTAYGQTTVQAVAARSQAVELTGLMPNTTYHYRVIARESSTAQVVSTDRTFTTDRDITPPTNPSGFSATTRGRAIDLVWTNPVEPDFYAVELRARTDRHPTTRADGRFVYQGSETSFTDVGLSPGVQYFYTLFAIDAANNGSSGALATAAILSVVTTLPTATTTEPVVSSTRPVILPTATQSTGSTTSTTSTSAVISTGNVTSTPIIATSTLPGSVTSTEVLPGEEVLPPIITQPATSTEPVQETSATVTTSTALALHPLYYAGDGAIELTRDVASDLSILPNQRLLVRLALQGLPSIQHAELRVGTRDTYRLTLSPQGDALIASFLAPARLEGITFVLQARFQNGTVSNEVTRIRAVETGQVREASLLSQRQLVLSGATVKLLVKKQNAYVVWDGRTSSQPNPVTTDAQGRYVFLVPSGEYRLEVSKEGYKQKTVDVEPLHQFIATRVELYRLPQGLTAVLDPQASVKENIAAFTKNAEDAIGVALDTVQTPNNQAVAQQVVTPVVITVAVANTATAVTAFSFLNYLHFLLAQPLLLIHRRKRKKWGVVYNTLTKQPIDLAIVRLIHAKTRVVVQTSITDAQGRYSFRIHPGAYYVEVIKPTFTFPTKLLTREQVDDEFVDVYHGELVSVKSDSILTLNIPVDPTEHAETPRHILRKRRLRRLQSVVGMVGIAASVFAVIVSPTLYMFGFLLLQIGLYFLFRRLAMPPKSKDWGVIYEEGTKKRLAHAVVRIFDKKYNKLLETQVTDSQGRYGFVVGKNTYYLMAEKAGYERYRSTDLDLTQQDHGTIDQPIALKRALS